MSRLRIAMLACVLCVRFVAAAELRQATEPAPEWVTDLPVPEAGATLAGADVQYLLVDRQLQYAEISQTYVRHVLRLLNESGVQQNSQININFDPEREKVRVHRVTLRRGNRIIDAFASGRVEVLQRERNLERNLLDGSLTFHVLLADVRVGDTLEYSFTIEHRDAEWNNRHYSRLNTAWDVPVRASRLRLRVGADAPLRFALNHEAPPVESRDGAWRVLEWKWRDLPGKPGEATTPSWHDQYPSVELSQFLTWRDVVTPLLDLYALPTSAGPELSSQVAKIRAAGGTDAARALAVIRFVQEQIRYTGLELGVGAFKPTDPEVVLQRRYGDCKDKALLAVALLRGLGFEANPALVSTVWQSHLDARLPSPGVFDHVIVRTKVGGNHYWWDATATAQGGGLADFSQSDLGAALVVSVDSSAIVPIPLNVPRSPEINANVVYDLRTGLDETSAIVMTTRYRGREADSMRSRMRGQTPRELGLQYENYYKRIFPQLHAAGEPNISDDFAANVLTVEERYRATELFEKPDDQGVRRFSLDADLISASLVAPSTPVRTAPLALRYPVNAAVKVEVRLPEEWSLKPEDVGIEDPFFQYRSRLRRIGNDVFLEYEYRTLADNIPAAQLDEHLQRREKARLDSHLQLSYRLTGDAKATGSVAELSQRARAILSGAVNRSAGQSRQMIDELRQSRDWERVPEELRQGLAVFAGAMAFEQEDWKTAHREMKQGIALSSDGQLWVTYVDTSTRAHEFEDAADAAATLLERWPNEFVRFTDEGVARVVWGSDADGVARYRLLTAMFKGNYQRKDGLDVDEWWVGLVRAQLERGQLDAARKTLGRVRAPDSLILIQADNRFEAIRSALSRSQQPDRATDAHIEWLRSVARQHPRDLSVALEVSRAQLDALRFEEALQTLDALLKRTHAPDGAQYFTDHEQQYPWVLDYRSQALRGLGRWEEALVQLREAQAANRNADLVSQGINLALLYNRMGRPTDARAELIRLKGEKASNYGKQLMAAAALNSAVQLGDQAEAEQQLEYLAAQHDANPSGYLEGLLALDRLDEAAEQVTRMLEDPDQRTDVLMAAQNYPVDALPAPAQVLLRRWRQVLERPQVREAVAKVGRIGTYKSANPMF